MSEPQGDRLRRWLRVPALHFVAIGALLFALTGAGGGRERPRLVISAAQVEQLRHDFIRQTGAQPSPADEHRLLEQAIEEELLVQQALALGLDRGDRAIRFRLADKMRFLEGGEEEEGAEEGSGKALYRQAVALGLDREDVVVRRILVNKMRLIAGMDPAEAPFTEAELADHLARHTDRYRQPARISLTQLFLGADGPEAQARGQALSARLRTGQVAPATALREGKPLPVASRLRSKSQEQLSQLLGPAFSQAAFALEPGTWAWPIASPYGLHLVWVEAREPDRIPALQEVRRQVEQALRTERREQRMRRWVEQLRLAYDVRVERAGVAPDQGS